MMIEPKNGEWWMCDRGGVNAVFLRLENDWRGDNNDTYSFGDAIPLYRMIEDKQIPQKPPVRVEYEKVEFDPEEIWKAFKEHQEDGHLFVANKDEYECLGDGVFELAMAIYQGDQLYRRIEKPVDWRDEVAGFLNKGLTCHDADSPWFDLSNEFRFDGKLNKRDFLEMCRIALRANGEL